MLPVGLTATASRSMAKLKACSPANNSCRVLGLLCNLLSSGLKHCCMLRFGRVATNATSNSSNICVKNRNFMSIIYFVNDRKFTKQFCNNTDPVLVYGIVLNLAACGTFRISLISLYLKRNEPPSARAMIFSLRLEG